ncbi:hypothetical protein BG58_31450 [Caballeronia jiangsuensis]|nr:hypothetical protein BG58_31450 [Caballeronia jiangsuensis]
MPRSDKGKGMSASDLRSMIDAFFVVHPHRSYFVYCDPGELEGIDTFVVVTRSLDVVAFNRAAGKEDVPAAALADWFSDTDEGQETIERMIAGMDDEMRVGAEVQARGELAVMPASPTAH